MIPNGVPLTDRREADLECWRIIESKRRVGRGFVLQKGRWNPPMPMSQWRPKWEFLVEYEEEHPTREAAVAAARAWGARV